MNTMCEKRVIATSLLLNLQVGVTNVGEYYLKNKVNNLNSNIICSDINIEPLKLLEAWQVLLDISHWSISLNPIDEMQVVDDLNDGNPGNEFVGIAIDFKNRKGIIYHTRPLLEDDIIHELLHVRFPDWSEQKVNNWTNLLINQSNINLLKLDRAS